MIITCKPYERFMETYCISKRTFRRWRKNNFRLDEYTKAIIDKDMEFLNKIASHETVITMASLFMAYKKATPKKKIRRIKRTFARMARRWLLGVKSQYVYFY